MADYPPALLDFGLTETFDMDLSGSEFVMISDIYVVQQRLDIRLNIHQGEWLWDIYLGMAYRELVLKKNPNESIITVALQKVILDTPGITRILSWELEIDKATRHMIVNCEAETPYGAVLITTDPEADPSAENWLPIWMISMMGMKGSWILGG